jgi:Tfp pilus assembly protein PilN
MAINLLPLKPKESLHYEDLDRQVMFIGEMMFSLLMLLIILVLGVVMFGKYRISELQKRIDAAQNREEVKNIASFQQQFRTMKSDIDNLDTIQSNHPSSFMVLKDFIGKIAPLVELNGISADLNSKTITFTGVARERNDLLALDKHFNDDKTYSPINLSLSNLVKETNIPFSFNVKYQ